MRAVVSFVCFGRGGWSVRAVSIVLALMSVGLEMCGLLRRVWKRKAGEVEVLVGGYLV